MCEFFFPGVNNLVKLLVQSKYISMRNFLKTGNTRIFFRIYYFQNLKVWVFPYRNYSLLITCHKILVFEIANL